MGRGAALVTGAAGGVGAALCAALAARGHPTVAVDVDADRLRAVVDALSAGGHRVEAHVVNVADAPAMEALARAVHATHGPLDVLVNNVGVAIAGPLVDAPLGDVARLVDVNLAGVALGCAAFGRAMSDAPGTRHIVNIASAAAFGGVPHLAVYAATKAGVLALSEGLAAEHDPAALRVTVVCPGFLPTGMTGALAMPPIVKWLHDRPGRGPDDVAARVVRALDRGEHRVLVYAEARLGVVLGALPSPVAAALRRRLARRVVRSAPGWG